MSMGAAIAVGAVTGLALGIVISLTTDVPLAPEVGLLLGGRARGGARRDPPARHNRERPPVGAHESC